MSSQQLLKDSAIQVICIFTFLVKQLYWQLNRAKPDAPPRACLLVRNLTAREKTWMCCKYLDGPLPSRELDGGCQARGPRRRPDHLAKIVSCLVTHGKSKYSTQNSIYSWQLWHKLRYTTVKSCPSNITPLGALCMCSTSLRYRRQPCPKTRDSTHVWFPFRNLHHLVNKLLLILRNRHGTFWSVRRRVRQSACTIGL